jgi:hypothetical protein
MKREINTRSINNTTKGGVPNLKGLAAVIVTVLFFGAVIFGQAPAKLTQVGAGNPAADAIIKAKTAIDEAIKIVEAEIAAEQKKKK